MRCFQGMGILSPSRSAFRYIQACPAGSSLRIGLARSLSSAYSRSPLIVFPRQPRRTHLRLLSTSTIPPSSFSQPLSLAESSSSTRSRADVPPSLPRWLYGCSALVFGIVIIGGFTRLTESGLSITEWQPITGILPPMSDDEWVAEWEKYRVSPEGIMTNSRIEMDEFKKIFYMEWAHRIAGRALGVAFVIPTIYYLSRYRLPRLLQAKLVLLGAGIGFQGVLGWYMVKSGLDQEIIETNAVPRVSQYRLAAHLSAALALYIGMIHTALTLSKDRALQTGLSSSGPHRRWTEKQLEMLSSPAIGRYRGIARLALAMVFLTAVSGAFVAGLDAGLVYNEFPTMGGRLVPPNEELMDPRYGKRKDGGDRWWRNLLENPVTAQFDHRLLATTTFTLLISLPFLPRIMARRGSLAVAPATLRTARATAAMAVAQVTLGISTLLYLVPVPLAAAHQAGSVILLTLLTGLVTSLRRPSKAISLLHQASRASRPVTLHTP